jgi:hypothetical protein
MKKKTTQISNSKIIPIHKQEYDGEDRHEQCAKENLHIGVGAVFEVGVIWPLDERGVSEAWTTRMAGTAMVASGPWTLRFEVDGTVRALVTDFRGTSWRRDSGEGFVAVPFLGSL